MVKPAACRTNTNGWKPVINRRRSRMHGKSLSRPNRIGNGPRAHPATHVMILAWGAGWEYGPVPG